jgi:hypothetical protein
MNLPAWALDAVSGLPGLISKAEAAEFLQVSERTIATLCHSGDIKHIKRSVKGSSRIMIPRQFMALYLVSVKRGNGGQIQDKG